MASYIVKFSIEIPVSGKGIHDEIDAYYSARDRFNNYNVNIFDKKIVPSDEETCAKMQAELDKLTKF